MLVIQRNGIMNLEAGNEEERLRSRGSCEVRPFSLFLFLVSARKEGEDEENQQ